MTRYQAREVGCQGPGGPPSCKDLHSILKALGNHRRVLKTWFSEKSLHVAVMNDANFCRTPSPSSEAKEQTVSVCPHGVPVHTCGVSLLSIPPLHFDLLFLSTCPVDFRLQDQIVTALQNPVYPAATITWV